MSAPIEIGTARSQPGQIVYGTFDAVPLPTGGVDALPIIIAQGKRAQRPTLWLTANIHGGEYNGLAAIHRLLTPELVAHLSGTVIAIPTLNPAGLRIGERSPYYLYGRDPNRSFPHFSEPRGSNQRPRSALEIAYSALFEHIAATADFLLDLHDYGISSIPFIFRDPVFYEDIRERAAAETLQARVGKMVAALGLTVINEYVSSDYLKLNLHRSVSGSTLNTARIPAVTIEIGGQRAVNMQHVAGLVSSIRNMMRWAGMLPGPSETVEGFPVIDLGYTVRRTTHPRVTHACIIEHLVQPGDLVAAGTPLARMRDIYGRPVGPHDGLLSTEYDGFIMGMFPGIAFYPNEAVYGLAIRDDGDMVIRLRS